MRRIFPAMIAIGLLMVGAPASADELEEEAADEEVDDVEAAENDEPADEEVDEADAAEEDELAEEGEEVAEEDEETTDDRLAFGEPDPAAGGGHPMFAIAPRVGLTAPQPFNDLNSWPVFGADVGVILPVDIAGMERPLQIGVDVSYTRPGAEGDGTHAMLGGPDDGGADYQWELDQQMLTLQLTTMWRFGAPGQGFGAHAIVGPRIYLMESILNAEGNEGANFGENRETNTEYGVVFGGGVEYELGPGSVVGTLLVGGSPLDQRITGEANTAAFNLDVGYRLFF